MLVIVLSVTSVDKLLTRYQHCFSKNPRTTSPIHSGFAIESNDWAPYKQHLQQRTKIRTTLGTRARYSFEGLKHDSMMGNIHAPPIYRNGNTTRYSERRVLVFLLSEREIARMVKLNDPDLSQCKHTATMHFQDYGEYTLRITKRTV